MTRAFSALAADIASALAKPLPGAAAHALMSPRPRRAWPDGIPPPNIRNAAGLLLVFPDTAGHSHIVLTVRADTLGRHGGQVSLPGGVIEPGESYAHAALREAHEEIALDPALVRIAGALSPIDIPVSNFRLHPIVGLSDARPALMPADGEVAKILDIAIDDLITPRALAQTVRERDGTRIDVPVFRAGGEEIWGATAMVLAEFLTLIGWSK